MSMIQQKKILSKHGYFIPAIYSAPDEDTNRPLVVMCHGTASDKNEVLNAYMLTSLQLASSGIASIRFDFVGTGDSEVDYIHYSYSSATSDVLDVIAYAVDLGYTSIHLLGWSQGGTIACLSANDVHVKSVITWAGAHDLSILANKNAYQLAKKDGFYHYEPGFRAPLKLGLQWFEEVYHTDVLKEFKKSHQPVCAICGTRDTIVNPKQSKKIVEASAHPLSELHMIEGANHIFNVFDGLELLNQVIQITINWIKKFE